MISFSEVSMAFEDFCFIIVNHKVSWALSHISHCCTIKGLLLHLYSIHTGLPAARWAQQVIAKRNSTSLMIFVFEGDGKTYYWVIYSLNS